MDLEPSRRVGGVCWAFGGAVSLVLMLIAPPTEAIGQAGWYVALGTTAISYVGAYLLMRRGSRVGFDGLLRELVRGHRPGGHRRMAGRRPRYALPPALPGGRHSAPGDSSATARGGLARCEHRCPGRSTRLRERHRPAGQRDRVAGRVHLPARLHRLGHSGGRAPDATRPARESPGRRPDRARQPARLRRVAPGRVGPSRPPGREAQPGPARPRRLQGGQRPPTGTWPATAR